MRLLLGVVSLLSIVLPAHAQKDGPVFTGVGSGARAFEQLDDKLPTPNVYRAATGEPGPEYWQQQADYDIAVELLEDTKRIEASETITYTNNSPHELRYLWVSLDQNRFKNDSLARQSERLADAGRRPGSNTAPRLSFGSLARDEAFKENDYGFEIESVVGSGGQDLEYTIVDTMMRVDLPRPLRPGGRYEFAIGWSFNIINESVVGGRGGYESFPVDAEEPTNDTIYFLAQWFPRMAAFTDYEGWHNKAFLGRGEFTLEFGDYEVAITVPDDHIVSATGELQNPNQVLTAEQRSRLREAESADSPVFIVTPEEAAENEKEGSSGTKTWRFKADQVRDFAWSSSRKFIWDAMGFEQEDDENPLVMAMSFYPNEAEPIWSQYSTEAVIHTMDVYNKFSFNYPYPTAQSVNAWERGGMEYPMITFNGYRPTTKDNEDGEVTYSRNIKYGLIGVIIHEIGHIYFPMTVNSDERQWTWMDEGINTFLEYVAEYEWEENFPILGGRPNPNDVIIDYMTSTNQVPIMTQSDSIVQFGPNAYSKPASALVILRETVLGRELFDPAFREYSRRWKFKRPAPADFFRTMEEVSGKDLDWFWRGWWYTTDHVDIAVTGMQTLKISSQDPDAEADLQREQRAADEPEPLAQRRNREEGIETRLERRRDQLTDFYNENDEFEPNNQQRNDYKAFLEKLNPQERALWDRVQERDPFVHIIDFRNMGGLVMPIPLKMTYADGSEEEMVLPAEVWRYDAEAFSKLIISDKEIVSVEIDANNEIADADEGNNAFPGKPRRSRFELFQDSRRGGSQMADSMVELSSDDEEAVNTELDGDDKGETAEDQGPDVPLEPAEDNDAPDGEDGGGER
ncbi:M1 family metallopeptidase [Parvularcula maris]|uniref:M1 family metallopeptidase n=1 Tax=Parvularcula maris TaxID=2965077 RepID=UPI00211449E1